MREVFEDHTSPGDEEIGSAGLTSGVDGERARVRVEPVPERAVQERRHVPPGRRARRLRLHLRRRLPRSQLRRATGPVRVEPVRVRRGAVVRRRPRRRPRVPMSVRRRPRLERKHVQQR